MELTKENLIDWIDRPPSNSDLDIIKDIVNKDKEIERLNNIINELEKYLWEERYNHHGEYVYTGKRKVEEVYTMILDKIKELKGEYKE